MTFLSISCVTPAPFSVKLLTQHISHTALRYSDAVIESLAVDESRVGGVKQMLSGLRWSLVDSKSATEHQVGFPIGLCALKTPP